MTTKLRKKQKNINRKNKKSKNKKDKKMQYINAKIVKKNIIQN